MPGATGTRDRRAGGAALAQTAARFASLPWRVLPLSARGRAAAPRSGDASVANPSAVGPAPVSEPAIDPNHPVLTSLLTTRGRRPGWAAIVITAVVAGGLAGAVTSPIAAPIVVVAVVLGCLVPWSRAIFALAPVGLLVATGVYVAVRQHQQQIATNIEWPAQFPLANTLAWMAVAALVAAGAVEMARWRPWVPNALAEEDADHATPDDGPVASDGHQDEPALSPGVPEPAVGVAEAVADTPVSERPVAAAAERPSAATSCGTGPAGLDGDGPLAARGTEAEVRETGAEADGRADGGRPGQPAEPGVDETVGGVDDDAADLQDPVEPPT